MNSQTQKTIFIVLATRTRINFMLRADLFRILRQSGLRVVIVTPFWNDEDFRREFGTPNVVIEPLRGPKRFSLTLAWWRGQAMLSDHPLIKFGIRAHSFITRRFRKPESLTQKIKNLVRRGFFALIPDRFLRSPRFWDRLENIFISRECAEELMRKYHPAAVILASAGAEEKDGPFLLACGKYGIPSLVIDTNIDAPQMRYFSPPRAATKYAVFGPEMKREFIELHGVDASRLAVTGPLRYDFYFKEFKPEAREEFFKKIGVDPVKKLITFGAKIPIMYPHNADIMKIISRAIADGRFGDSAQLFVRFDPRHDPNLYSDLLPLIVYERAEDAAHREHIANLLYHSDVVISVASTFCIEAALVGTPSVWIGFDGYHKYDKYEESTRIHYDYDVFQRIIKTGAVALAETPEELIVKTAGYLRDRNSIEIGRNLMIEKEYFKDDGLAGERIAELAVKLIDGPERCGVCGQRSAFVRRGTHEGYMLWECGACLAQFWSPMQSPGAEWYSRDERYSFRNNAPLRRPERNHREFLRDLPARGGKLLDVGMGTGNFLFAAQEAGYDVYGIDFDQDAIAAAKEHFGLRNVFAADIDDMLVKFGPEHLDIVTMFEVLEHLDEPSKFIDKVSRILKIGGYLALSVPDRGSWDVFKIHDKPPRHLTRWSEDAMRNFLFAHGFEIVRMKKMPVSWKFLINKFYFWTKSILGFELVKRASVAARKEGNRKTVSARSATLGMRAVEILAAAKSWILFFVPMIVLYSYLLVTQKESLGLYVLARKVK